MKTHPNKSGVGKYVLIFLLALCMLISCSGICAHASGASDTENAAEITLQLNRQNPEENQAFQMENLFPGDSETRYYRLSVSYTGTIAVVFQAQNLVGDEKLGEALKIRVRLVDTDEVLYEGSLAAMPELQAELTTDKDAQTDELCYEITAGLGAEAGNEYQSKVLIADLSWWAEDVGENSAESGSGSGGGLVDAPDSGDHSRIILWLGCAGGALMLILLILGGYQRRLLTGAKAEGVLQSEQFGFGQSRQTAKEKRRKLWVGMILLVLLLAALGITSLALVYQEITVEGNLFATGKVSICLNDNEPVFDEEILFEPGMVIEKEFTLRNESSCDVYYRLWFTDITGDFADELEVELSDGETILFQGKLSELNGVKSEGADGMLLLGEERILTIIFRVPETAGNVAQGETILFDLNAEAVQAVNNPDSMFE